MNLYLSKALVPYEITARWRKDGGFSDSYQWHRRAWECFPDQPDARRDFLTRLDDTGEGFRLLILSARPALRPKWCPEDNWQSKTVSEHFLGQHSYRFSLLANPTRKIRSEESPKNGRRVPLVSREELLAWLERKGTDHGFRVMAAQVRTIPRPRQFFVQSTAKRTGVHTATEFTGVLEVVDPAAFRAAFSSGIGSAKAFGFGMLCLAPAH